MNRDRSTALSPEDTQRVLGAEAPIPVKPNAAVALLLASRGPDKFVPTSLGVFKYTEQSGFLFRCPVCEVYVPMDEEIMAGRKPIDHPAKEDPARFCSYHGTREYGPVLVSTMQARHLMRMDGEDIRTYVLDEQQAIHESGEAISKRGS